MQRPTTTAPNRRPRTSAEAPGSNRNFNGNPIDIWADELSDSDASGDTEALEAVLALEEAAMAEGADLVEVSSTGNSVACGSDFGHSDSMDLGAEDPMLSSDSDSEFETDSEGNNDGDYVDDATEWNEGLHNAYTEQFNEAPPTLWKLQRQKFLKDFEKLLHPLLTAIVQWETTDASAPHRQCSGLIEGVKCTKKPSFRCYTCAANHSANHFCDDCSILHQWNTRCHHLGNSENKSPPLRMTGENKSARFPEIRCCSQASGGGRIVKLHSLTGSEIIRLKRCQFHDHGDMCVVMVREFGFFPSQIQNTPHAFSYSLLSLSLKLRRLGTAFQASAEAFFGTELKDAKATGLYQPFMDAVRQLAVLWHHKHHGLFSPDIVKELGLGQTVCPACVGGENADTPAIFNMDGFESANKKSKEHGGGGSHGHFGYTSVLFKTPTVKNVVEEAKSKGKQVRVAGCESQHKAGTEAAAIKSNGKDVSRIIHIGCATHSIVHRVYDVPFGGEPLWYSDDAIAWGLDCFFGRAFVLGYDVACKELSHLVAHHQFERIIERALLFMLFIPAMHVYAHGKDCQCLFSPRQIHGLGKTLDGEGVERYHSYLSPSIGLTQQETAENRHMDIFSVTDQYNQSKIRGLVSWTVRKLSGVFAELDGLRVILGNSWRIVEDSKYEDTVKETTSGRHQLLEGLGAKLLSNKEQLRLQIDDLARTIVAIDKHLKRGPGTKMASRLKKALSTTFASLYYKLADYNELEPKESPPLKFADVKAALTQVPTLAEPNQMKALVNVYWRLSEDVYHHRNYLKNVIGYYKSRLENHWSVVLHSLAGVGEAREVEAWQQTVKRRTKVEDEYSNQAACALEMFEEVGNAMLWKEANLMQIHTAFTSKDSVLSFQNLRPTQRI
ncbi:hypothetical protein BDR26DRAFT_192418 [Obelidium mucronatum]|nr:hypothetical protein BDR26DRAFT_192418 [Obelidium mucronatum]